MVKDGTGVCQRELYALDREPFSLAERVERRREEEVQLHHIQAINHINKHALPERDREREGGREGEREGERESDRIFPSSDQRNWGGQKTHNLIEEKIQWKSISIHIQADT